jgi:hypothetical protein
MRIIFLFLAGLAGAAELRLERVTYTAAPVEFSAFWNEPCNGVVAVSFFPPNPTNWFSLQWQDMREWTGEPATWTNWVALPVLAQPTGPDLITLRFEVPINRQMAFRAVQL